MILPLTIAYAAAIAVDLRPQDRAEIIAAEGGISDWGTWGKRQAQLDGPSYVGILDGQPFVTGGFCQVAGPSDVCAVWMVATDRINTVRGSRIAARLVASGHRKASQRFKVAVACSDMANVDGMRMLLRLGYRPAGKSVNLNGHDFVQMRADL